MGHIMEAEKENCVSQSSSSFNNSESSVTESPNLYDTLLKLWNLGAIAARGYGAPTVVSQVERSSLNIIKIVEGRLVQLERGG